MPKQPSTCRVEVIRVLLLFVYVLVCLPGLLAAEYSGVVKVGNQPVPGATLTATRDGKKVVTSTDEAGQYKLDLDDGQWSISIEMFGFRPETKKVTITGAKVSADEWRLAFTSRDALTQKAGPAGQQTATSETPRRRLGPGGTDNAQGGPGGRGGFGGRNGSPGGFGPGGFGGRGTQGATAAGGAAGGQGRGGPFQTARLNQTEEGAAEPDNSGIGADASTAGSGQGPATAAADEQSLLVNGSVSTGLQNPNEQDTSFLMRMAMGGPGGGPGGPFGGGPNDTFSSVDPNSSNGGGAGGFGGGFGGRGGAGGAGGFGGGRGGAGGPGGFGGRGGPGGFGGRGNFDPANASQRFRDYLASLPKDQQEQILRRMRNGGGPGGDRALGTAAIAVSSRFAACSPIQQEIPLWMRRRTL